MDGNYLTFLDRSPPYHPTAQVVVPREAITQAKDRTTKNQLDGCISVMHLTGRQRLGCDLHQRGSSQKRFDPRLPYKCPAILFTGLALSTSPAPFTKTAWTMLSAMPGCIGTVLNAATGCDWSPGTLSSSPRYKTVMKYWKSA